MTTRFIALSLQKSRSQIHNRRIRKAASVFGSLHVPKSINHQKVAASFHPIRSIK